MDRKKLLKNIVILMLLMVALYEIEARFYLYNSIWWFDMLMHFLGGFWVGLFFLYALKIKDSTTSSMVKVFIWLLSMSIAWEFFEFYANNYIGHDSFSPLDTFSDLFFDMAGGLVSLFYLFKNIMPSSRLLV